MARTVGITHLENVTMPTLSTKAKLVLIGDSIIANFDKYNDNFEIFFLSFRTLSFGISGDKIQNVLRHVCNMTFSNISL